MKISIKVRDLKYKGKADTGQSLLTPEFQERGLWGQKSSLEPTN